MRPPWAVAIACRTLLVLLPMLVWVNAEMQGRWCVVATAQAQASSGAGLFDSLHITGRSVNALPRKRTTVVLKGPSGTSTLRVRDLSVRVRYTGPDGRRVTTADAMTEGDVLAWMGAAGVDVASDAAIEEARAIGMLIRHVTAGGRAFRDHEKGPGMAALARVGVATGNRATSRWWVLGLIVSTGLAMWCIFTVDLLPWRRIWRCRSPVAVGPSG